MGSSETTNMEANGFEASGMDQNGLEVELAVDDVELPDDLKTLYAEVQADPRSFDTWVQLLTAAENTVELRHSRMCFDAFLEQFPLCFGYWKKYADLELKKAGAAGAKAIYERGLVSVPLSVDLWRHYLTFLQSEACVRDAATYEYTTPDVLRSAFERAIGACGGDWRSHPLWDAYIKWEGSQGEGVSLAGLFVRAMNTPIQLHMQYMSRYRTFVKEHEPEQVMAEAEIESYKAAILQEKGIMSETALKEEIKSRLLDARQEYVNHIKAEVEWRAHYEDKLKRNYFHAKPLDATQLQTWRQYLDAFSARPQIQPETIDFLYERCLVPCALYDEFWLRFARHLMLRSEDKARELLARATTHIADRPSIHLFLSALQEKQGDRDLARTLMAQATALAPALAETAVRWSNMELRFRNVDGAIRALDKCIEANPDDAKTRCFLTLAKADVYSRGSDGEKARQVYGEAMDEFKDDERVYYRALSFEMSHRGADQFSRMDAIFDKALNSDLPEADKVELARRRMDMCDKYAPDIDSYIQAQVQYIKMAPSGGATETDAVRSTLKRPADTHIESAHDKVARAASATTDTEGQSEAATTPAPAEGTAAAWTGYHTGYGTGPEAWAAYAAAYPGYAQWGQQGYPPYYPAATQ